MRPSALRLDSFTPNDTRMPQFVTAHDIDEAYHRGYDKGFGEGREVSLDALTQALGDLRMAIATRDAWENTMRATILGDTAALLHAIVDILAPRSEQTRLREALRQELSRLIQYRPEETVVIRCPPDLRPDLDACLTDTPFSSLQIEDADPGQSLVELVSAQARITFDPAAIARNLKAIIDDIKTED